APAFHQAVGRCILMDTIFATSRAAITQRGSRSGYRREVRPLGRSTTPQHRSPFQAIRRAGDRCNPAANNGNCNVLIIDLLLGSKRRELFAVSVAASCRIQVSFLVEFEGTGPAYLSVGIDELDDRC